MSKNKSQKMVKLRHNGNYTICGKLYLSGEFDTDKVKKTAKDYLLEFYPFSSIIDIDIINIGNNWTIIYQLNASFSGGDEFSEGDLRI